jgi:hypothetical protein
VTTGAEPFTPVSAIENSSMIIANVFLDWMSVSAIQNLSPPSSAERAYVTARSSISVSHAAQKSGHGAHKRLECGECRLKPSLCDPLPVYIVVTIDGGYPSVQYMGLCIEGSVEIFVHRCGLCLSS